MVGREGIPEIIVDPPSANPLAIKAPTVPNWETHVATGVLATEALTLRALFGSQVIGILPPGVFTAGPSPSPVNHLYAHGALLDLERLLKFRIAHGSGDGVCAWKVSPFTRINQRNYPVRYFCVNVHL